MIESPDRFQQRMDCARKKYEFSDEVRVAALRRSDYCCEALDCLRNEDLQVHHIVSIGFYRKNKRSLKSQGFNEGIMSSLANAEVLCKDCHSDYHYYRESRFDIETMVVQVLSDYQESVLALFQRTDLD